MDSFNLLSDILPVIGISVAVVNIITQVLKAIFGKANAKVCCFITSMIISILFIIATSGLSIRTVLSGITCGFCVTYIAMFGYDNLYSDLAKFLGGKKDESN